MTHDPHITLQIGDHIRYEIRGDVCHEVTPTGRKRVSRFYALQRHARYRSTLRPTIMERKKNDLFWIGFSIGLATLVTAILLLLSNA